MLTSSACLRVFFPQLPEVLNSKWLALQDHWSSKKLKLLGKWFCFKNTSCADCSWSVYVVCVFRNSLPAHKSLTWPILWFSEFMSHSDVAIFVLFLLMFPLSFLLSALFSLSSPFCWIKKASHWKELHAFYKLLEPIGGDGSLWVFFFFFGKCRWIFWKLHDFFKAMG